MAARIAVGSSCGLKRPDIMVLRSLMRLKRPDESATTVLPTTVSTLLPPAWLFHQTWWELIESFSINIYL